MDSTILSRLSSTNPWLFGRGALAASPLAQMPEPWVGRKQVDVSTFSRPDEAHLVIGPRQAGKSTLVWSYLRTLTRPLFLNLEEPSFRMWCRSAAGFLADLSELGSPPDAIFLEEAQHLDEAGLFVKGLVDARLGSPIVVTGSSSFHLMARTRESLAGRARRHVLLPFSLGEVSPFEAASAVRRIHRDACWPRLARIGGYPRAWLGDDAEDVLGRLLQAFVLQDASDLLRVDRIDAFQAILQLAAGQVGNLVNLSEWASICGVSVGTVSRYLSLMEETHLLRLVPSFSGGRRKEVTSARKVFFLDNGLRNSLLGQVSSDFDVRPDKGAVFENLVFTEIVKALPWTVQVRYWRSLSGAEVDFIVEMPGGLLAVEAKSTALASPRLSRSTRSFLEAYRPRMVWVVNTTLESRAEVVGVTVRWLPLADLPEALCEITDGWMRT